MGLSVLGKKLGMTRVFDDAGVSVPVTVIEVGPCVVTQVKTSETDGYDAVQIAYGDMKARNSSIPMIAHDAKAGTGPKRIHSEFRLDESQVGSFEVGQEIGVGDFSDQRFIDVIGTSKGKGYAGTMKRHNFKGQLASHGVERKHRSPGSIGGHASEAGASGRPKKGKKMAGQMGNAQVTTRSAEVVRIDADRGLMLVKGPVPGPSQSVVSLRPAVRLNRSKQRRLASGE